MVKCAKWRDWRTGLRPPTGGGVGLLLLRATLGAALLGQGVLEVVVAGILTPAAGVLAAVLCLLRALAPPSGGAAAQGAPVLPLLAVMGVTVLLLGPGAFSLDARLFGRREIVVSRASRGRPGSEGVRPPGRAF